MMVHYGNILLSITSIIITVNSQLSQRYEHLSSFEDIVPYLPEAKIIPSIQLLKNFGAVLDVSQPFQPPIAECQSKSDCVFKAVFSKNCSCNDHVCVTRFAEFTPRPCGAPTGCGSRIPPAYCECREREGSKVCMGVGGKRLTSRQHN
jgi:hypothetical protein